jgi:glucosyl-3-phosphoglycerate synthase
MAATIYATALERLGRAGRLKGEEDLVTPVITQFARGEEGFEPRVSAVPVEERPPMERVPEYREWRRVGGFSRPRGGAA